MTPYERQVRAVSEPTNILIVGVGGQGIVLASRLLATVAVTAGYDVKISEVHGMAQRGGSVVTHVRIGPKVYSPLIEAGTADFIVAFEKLEALRWLPYARADATIIVNDQEIPPLSVILGVEAYPPDIVSHLAAGGRRVVSVTAEEMAYSVGSAKSTNMVILGVLARYTAVDFKKEDWEAAVSAVVPPRTVEVNKRAFAAGYAYTA